MEKPRHESETTGQQQANGSNPTWALEQEYEQVNENFRMLADIRFKLLALIPPLGGVAIFLLSQAAITKQATPAVQPEANDYALVLLIACMGFLATLGVTFYDQRNNELYNALYGRAKQLEGLMRLPGGQFRNRPGRKRRLFFLILMGHDSGLALIYGTVLGAWFFPIVYSALQWSAVKTVNPFKTALLVSSVMALLFIAELLRLDGTWAKIWAKIRKAPPPEPTAAKGGE